jgi:hypothetical protein
MSFPLFTSIKPPASTDELAYLCECIDSWRAAGFDAVSVNGPAETERLRGLDLPVEFAAMATDGKPRIGAILDAIRQSCARFAGICNSDCKIVGYPNLLANLNARLHGAVVLAWRIDLGPDGKPTTQRGGFDAFLFDIEVIPRDDAGFSIAEPWWDHWFPLACEMSGARLETLGMPLLTHRDHPERWTELAFVRAADRFWAMLQSWHDSGDMPASLLGRLPAIDRELADLATLCAATPSWLFAHRPQTMALIGPDAADVENMLLLGGQAILSLAREQSREAEIAAYKNQLALIQRSTSWRITAPLRRAVIAVRAVAASIMPIGQI